MTTLFLSAFCTFLVASGLFLTREPLAIPSAAVLMGVLPGVALAHVVRTTWRDEAPIWTPLATNATLVAILAIWALAACLFVQEVRKASRPQVMTILVMVMVSR